MVRVTGHQQGPVLEVDGQGEQPHDLLAVEDLGKPLRLLGPGHVELRVGHPQGDAVEEPDAESIAIATAPDQPALPVEEVVLDLPGFDAVGAAAIVVREPSDCEDVGLDGVLGHAADGHVVDHFLA